MEQRTAPWIVWCMSLCSYLSAGWFKASSKKTKKRGHVSGPWGNLHLFRGSNIFVFGKYIVMWLHLLTDSSCAFIPRWNISSANGTIRKASKNMLEVLIVRRRDNELWSLPGVRAKTVYYQLLITVMTEGIIYAKGLFGLESVFGESSEFTLYYKSFWWIMGKVEPPGSLVLEGICSRLHIVFWNFYISTRSG